MREEQPSDREGGIDDDLLFVVEDLVDDAAQKPTRAPAHRAGARAPRRAEPKAERVLRGPQEVRVIIGSKRPRNPLYGKLARHAALLVAVAILVMLAPRGLGLLEHTRWARSRHGQQAAAPAAVVHKAPPPATAQHVADGDQASAPSAEAQGGDAAPPSRNQTLAEAASSELAAASSAAITTAPAGEQTSEKTAKASSNPREQTIDEFVAQLNTEQRSSLEAPPAEEPASEATTTQSHDTIVELKNGSHFRGTVKKMTDEQVILAYAHGQYTFARADLSRIIPPGSREYLPLETFPEAVVRLKGGGRFKAHVLKDSEASIVLGYSAGKLTFPRSEVEAIEYAKPDDAPFKAELPKFDFPEPAKTEPAPADAPAPAAGVPESSG